MIYTMTITKTFGNKKSIVVSVDADTKVDAMYRGLAKAAKEDRHNFKLVQPWQVNFENLKKSA